MADKVLDMNGWDIIGIATQAALNKQLEAVKPKHIVEHIKTEFVTAELLPNRWTVSGVI